MDWRKLGKRIREERLKLRLTQEQLAEKAGVNESYIGQIERGTKKPSLESIIKIAQVLGVSVDYLLQDSIEARKSGLLDELLAVASKRNDEEIRTLLNISKMMSKLVDRKK